MTKKIVSILAFSLFSSSFIFAHSVHKTSGNKTLSVQEQIAELKREIAEIKDQKISFGGDFSDHDNAKNITVPTNKGKIQNFLFSDIHDDVIPIGMLSSSQFALGILSQRNKYQDHALIFGGYLEADAQSWNGSTISAKDYNGNVKDYTSGQGIYLTTASVYMAANLGQYVTAEMTLSGNQNESAKFDDAFFILGNLDEFPLYAVIGKSRIPLGSFSGGGPWTDSLTQGLFRPSRVSNITVAYYKDGLSTNLTTFNTDDNKVNFAYAAFYGEKVGKWSYGINGGYVYNVYGTGNTSFDTATKNANNTGSNRIGAINFDASLNYNIYGIGAGWAQTTHDSVKTNDGKAGAWYISGGFSPDIYGRSTNFSLSYNAAYNTNDIPTSISGAAGKEYKTNAPSTKGANQLIIASVERPFLTQNILVGLEYAYMHMYSNKHSNSYTLDISVYF